MSSRCTVIPPMYYQNCPAVGQAAAGEPYPIFSNFARGTQWVEITSALQYSVCSHTRESTTNCAVGCRHFGSKSGVGICCKPSISSVRPLFTSSVTPWETMAETKKGSPGPLLGTTWWLLTVGLVALVASCVDCTAYHLVLGYRAAVALLGYLVMQVGLWHAELRWDEMGSTAYLEVAAKKVKEKVSEGMTPEELDATDFGDKVVIPEDKKKEAFPVPWGFLMGWWVWGLSYLLPLDGSANISPTVYGKVATVVCVAVSFVASVPMSDAVMNRLPEKKKRLSLAFLLGWITLGVMSALDVVTQLERAEGPKDRGLVWAFCMLGPFTAIRRKSFLNPARWEPCGRQVASPTSTPLSTTWGAHSLYGAGSASSWEQAACPG